MNNQFDFNIVLHGQYFDWLLSGIGETMALFLLAWTLGFVLAMILAVLRSTGIRPVEWLIEVFVEYQRNVPLLVQILFWYFAAPELLSALAQHWLNTHGSGFPLAIVALVLCSAAYISEDIRSGIRAIPSTQLEAARALGLTYLQGSRYIVMPQALRLSAPALINQALLLFKNTSLAMTIGVAELTYQSMEVSNNTFKTFESYAFATIVYLLISFSIMAAGGLVTRRLAIPGVWR